MPSPIIIRSADTTDAEKIITFNQRMAEETESKTLPSETISAGVKRVLTDPNCGTYYVACDDKKIVGQLMITLEWSDWRNGWFWWIQSVYVEPDYRKQGVFRELYAHIKKLAVTKPDVCGIRLYVEKDNERAQKTYLNLGMDVTHYLLMEEEFSVA